MGQAPTDLGRTGGSWYIYGVSAWVSIPGGEYVTGVPGSLMGTGLPRYTSGSPDPGGGVSAILPRNDLTKVNVLASG